MYVCMYAELKKMNRPYKFVATALKVFPLEMFAFF